MLLDVLEYLPEELKKQISIYFRLNNEKQNLIEEIRLRINKKVTLKLGQEYVMLDYIVYPKEILETFENICEKSVYSYLNEISEGFITIKGGNRVGISGNCVIENGRVININYISSLNFRIARQINNVSYSALNYILKPENNTIYNTLIISAPGGGKTTLLRDIVKNISNGMDYINFKGMTCGVVDERGEIAAMYKGTPQNDIGDFTDVISNVSKSIGINMLIRSMSPQVIVCDEIGTNEDICAIKKAFLSGVKGIFTAHGNDFNEILLNPNFKDLVQSKLIERIIILDSSIKGKIKEVIKN